MLTEDRMRAERNLEAEAKLLEEALAISDGAAASVAKAAREARRLADNARDGDAWALSLGAAKPMRCEEPLAVARRALSEAWSHREAAKAKRAAAALRRKLAKAEGAERANTPHHAGCHPSPIHP